MLLASFISLFEIGSVTKKQLTCSCHVRCVLLIILKDTSFLHPWSFGYHCTPFYLIFDHLFLISWLDRKVIIHFSIQENIQKSYLPLKLVAPSHARWLEW